MSWYKYAKPGDKVVCITVGGRHADIIKVGDTYTIREIFEAPSPYNLICAIGIELAEVPRWGHSAFIFRPLAKATTEKGMSMLNDILKGQPVKENA